MNFPLQRRTRSDAARNRDLIIDAAVTTLNERPRASMEDIAAAAGVSRATLYAHFRSRQALVETTLRRVLCEANAQIAALDPELTPEEAVDALLATSWRLLSQFDGLTIAAEGEVSSRELRRMHDEPADLMRRLLVQGRGDPRGFDGMSGGNDACSAGRASASAGGAGVNTPPTTGGAQSHNIGTPGDGRHTGSDGFQGRWFVYD